jgi:acylphosphatase
VTAVWFRVTGRVQGVGFRNFVALIADSFGIVGEVWNTRDGAVEGRAQGDRLEKFVSMLEGGPGVVDEVVSSETVVGDYSNFRITTTR